MTSPTAPGGVHAQLVETLRALAGSHPGYRVAHAKGVVCTGSFRAAPEASGICRAPHFQGQPVPVVARFSHGSGDPNAPDGAPSVRGLAVKFQLGGGASADVLGITVEGFPARTPEEFLAFLRAQLPDPVSGKPSPDAVPRFLAAHPAARAFVERLMQRPVPESYARATYHGEHAFRFTAASGTSRWGRYRFAPDAGEAFLSVDDAAKRSPNFLADELATRLRTGPAVFRLRLQLAGPSDPTDDPTALWPADRQVVELGRLELTAISPSGAADERRLIFDPGNCADGIEKSADAILLARSPAYSISYEGRTKGA